MTSDHIVNYFIFGTGTITNRSSTFRSRAVTCRSLRNTEVPSEHCSGRYRVGWSLAFLSPIACFPAHLLELPPDGINIRTKKYEQLVAVCVRRVFTAEISNFAAEEGWLVRGMRGIKRVKPVLNQVNFIYFIREQSSSLRLHLSC